MPWAAALIGGGLSYLGSSNAADAASQANAANIAAQQQWNALVDPFSAGGNKAQYVDQLNQLMQGGYAGLQADPMYQWMMSQGQDQLQRGMSATGGLGSGAEQIALQQQGFGLASSFFNDQYSRLAQLSGLTTGGGQAAIGQSPSAVYQQTSGTLSNQLAGIGLGMKGLSSIFGGGTSTTTPTTIYSGQYDPNSYGTYDPNPGGLNPNG